MQGCLMAIVGHTRHTETITEDEGEVLHRGVTLCGEGEGVFLLVHMATDVHISNGEMFSRTALAPHSVF